MGSYGFDVLPYYEYSGSKGKQGLGPQRRAKPLTRDDAYSHIKWVESSNADITDPDTDADFKKMLDLTVLRLKDKASFAGVWLRTRGQMPVGFGDATCARFAAEANGGSPVTREQLQSDKALYNRYIEWWEGKRRSFLTSLRDYLRANGVAHASVLYTGCAGEPGVGFGDFQPRLVPTGRISGSRQQTRQQSLRHPDAAAGCQPGSLPAWTAVARRELGQVGNPALPAGR